MTTIEPGAAGRRQQPIVTPFSEGRLKIISIEASLIVDILNWWREPPYWLSLPVTEQLPADCVVVAVSTNWERNCIEAKVASSQFPRVVDGAMLERIPGMLTEFMKVEFPGSV